MSFLGKSYTLDKSENFEEFLKAIGVTGEIVDRLVASKPTQKITKNGDTYTISTTDEKGTKEVSFQSGVEFDEQVREGLVSKTTFTVDGDVINQVQNYGDSGSMFIKREFSDSGIKVTLTVSKSDIKAVRYYVAA